MVLKENAAIFCPLILASQLDHLAVGQGILSILTEDGRWEMGDWGTG
jgi:hypothetical protein